MWPKRCPWYTHVALHHTALEWLHWVEVEALQMAAFLKDKSSDIYLLLLRQAEQNLQLQQEHKATEHFCLQAETCF